MILARASTYCIAASFALSAVQAQADVLEIDANGARWVAGDLVVLAAATASAATGETDASSSIVPGEALASAALNAANIPDTYKIAVHTLAERFDLSPSLLEALVWQESRWREDAVSHAGARGLAQLMPATAAELGVDPDDPMQNLEGGARYLREQLDRFDGDLEKALAAYNAGPGRVIRAGGIPNIYETKQYVATIMGRLASHARPDDR